MLFDRLFRKTPSSFNVQINSPETQVRASAKESLQLAAINHGIAFPYNCRVGGCGECKCRLVKGKVKELTDKSYLLSAEELRQNYILACQSQPRSDVVLEVALRAGPMTHPLVETAGSIRALTPLTRDILHVEIELDRPLAYTAGQYAEVLIPEAAGVAAGQGRSFSFASAPKEGEEGRQVDFFIRKVPSGAFTEWLFSRAKPGARLQLRGPHGDFMLRPGGGPMVCIAGGSGLAPIKALLEQAIADKQASRPAVVIFGARTQSDLYALDGIDQVRRAWTGRFEFVPILSAEPPDSGWTGRRGLIPEHLRELAGVRLLESHVYLCGPPPMIDACGACLAAEGLGSAQIFHDKFLPSGPVDLAA